MPNRQSDLIIIGGGIVGLATALQVLRRNPRLRLLVLEKEANLASHQTGHNSGVIHSGIYYRPGTLKARCSVAGAAAMVDFCRKYGIPHEICGKVIVATHADQTAGLDQLRRRALENGVPGVRLLSSKELSAIEPHARGVAALHVPGTGITNFAEVARKFAELVVESGGEILTNTRVLTMEEEHDGVVVHTDQGEFEASYAMNCAGLHSDQVARASGARLADEIIPFRGEYYVLRPERQHLVRGLIYPVADPRFPFLGVHFTRRINGQIEAGPNAVLAFGREAYRKSNFSMTDSIQLLTFPGFWRMAWKYWTVGAEEFYRSFSKLAFVAQLKELIPEISEDDLSPGGSGVRAQLVSRAGSLIDDFQFVWQGRVVHVCNVPSPAATASLEIASTIVQELGARAGLETLGANVSRS